MHYFESEQHVFLRIHLNLVLSVQGSILLLRFGVHVIGKPAAAIAGHRARCWVVVDSFARASFRTRLRKGLVAEPSLIRKLHPTSPKAHPYPSRLRQEVVRAYCTSQC